MGWHTRRRLRASVCVAFLLALSVILTPGPVEARGRGEEEVRAAVETWVRYVTADARPAAVIEPMEPIFKVGSITTFSAPTLVLDRPWALRGWDVTVCRE